VKSAAVIIAMTSLLPPIKYQKARAAARKMGAGAGWFSALREPTRRGSLAQSVQVELVSYFSVSLTKNEPFTRPKFSKGNPS
jgi:hypothetical protein